MTLQPPSRFRLCWSFVRCLNNGNHGDKTIATSTICNTRVIDARSLGRDFLDEKFGGVGRFLRTKTHGAKVRDQASLSTGPESGIDCAIFRSVMSELESGRRPHLVDILRTAKVSSSSIRVITAPRCGVQRRGHASRGPQRVLRPEGCAVHGSPCLVHAQYRR